jgi:hypothetical protein
MTGNDLATLYQFSYMAINRNLTDLTHQDSLHIPEPSGNCIDWVLGHIISARGMMLLLTGGGAPVLSEAEAAVFARGSAALVAGDQGVELGRLRAVL